MLLHLHWDHPWVRQRILPLLSTICLKSLAAKNQLQQQSSTISWEDSIVNQFIPHSIQRVKKDHFKEFYLLRWQSLDEFAAQQNWLGLKKKDGTPKESQTSNKNVSNEKGEGSDDLDGEGMEVDSMVVESGECDSKCVFTTVEEMALVEAACPGLVEAFERDQVWKNKTCHAIPHYYFQHGAMLHPYVNMFEALMYVCRCNKYQVLIVRLF